MSSAWKKYVENLIAAGAPANTEGDRKVIARFGELEPEYHALKGGPGLVDRSYRGLLEVTGKDRLSWLHNLTTNQVKTLGLNEGNYAFALNVQGRILFDLNAIVRPDSIWVDIDRRFLATARKHFDKYIIMEDVCIADRSDDWVRIALAGEKAKELVAALGAPQAATMASLSMTHIEHAGQEIPLLRHDFCGPFSVELFVPAGQAVAFWKELTESGRAKPVGDEAVQVRRIEAGIPWPGAEITDEVLPAETGQLERAVSDQKGCYLGQEIVERMRARRVVARLLVGLRVKGPESPPPGAEILSTEGAIVGKITSSCDSIALKGPITLGYVKSSTAAPDTTLRIQWEGHSADGVVANLPFEVA